MRLAVVLAVLVIVGAACSGSDTPVEVAAAPSTTLAPATTAAPTTAEPTTTTVTRIRDNDITDLDQLVAMMTADATGDPDWIEVFARLRAQSWLISRYPGEYDVLTTYGDEWAADTALLNDAENVELGLYLDSPLPRVVSVEVNREVGQLTELDVVLEVGDAVFRFAADDRPQRELLGGRHRGLFMLAPDGPSEGHRIHSIAEISLTETSNAEETNS